VVLFDLLEIEQADEIVDCGIHGGPYEVVKRR
jgi:hypothetical protein